MFAIAENKNIQIMAMIIGIDVGISTTKIVGLKDGTITAKPLCIRATDPVTSLYGAFGKYLFDNSASLHDVNRVMLTGVGSAYVEGMIYGLPTYKVDEFVADGLGARFATGLERMTVVSMGTGTSIVKCDGKTIRHLGGIGIGGGTLQGLSRLLLGTDDIHQVAEMAKQGDISNVNVLIGDISAKPLSGLPMDAIASLFGNVKSNATPQDIALGLIWMVLQSICSASILSSIGSGIKEFVMIGNLTLLPQCSLVLPATERLYGVKFRIPPHSEFCTAIGSALSPFKEKM